MRDWETVMAGPGASVVLSGFGTGVPLGTGVGVPGAGVGAGVGELPKGPDKRRSMVII